MASLQIFTAVKIIDESGRKFSLGSLVQPHSLSTLINGRMDFNTFAVAAAATATLWDATTSPCADFQFLWIESDLDDAVIELITDQNAGVGTEEFTLKLRRGVPFILAHNVSYANYTTNFAAGTLDVVDKILVKNLASSTANISICVVT